MTGTTLHHQHARSATARAAFRSRAAAMLVLLLAAATSACTSAEAVDPQPAPCAARVQSRLFFGLDMPGGRVPEAAWQDFVDGVVTPRFGDGLTVLEAHGQWRGANGATTKEPSRIVEVVHADSASHRRHLSEIVNAYKSRFRQEAVLVTQMPVRACV